MSKGLVSQELERALRRELEKRSVLVWYDAPGSWTPWCQGLLGLDRLPDAAIEREVMIDGLPARVLVFGGSYYELIAAAEPHLSGWSAQRPVLLYVPGEAPSDSPSPLRELECLGGDREPLVRDLRDVARLAFLGAGLPDSKIDSLLNHPGLTLGYLDEVVPTSGGSVSPLTPIFGSGREIDVLPLFLADEARRKQAAQQGLLAEVRALAERGLGVQLRATDDASELRAELARVILAAELRGDLSGQEPLAISRLPKPARPEQLDLARRVCDRLRLQHAAEYERLADEVEKALGLARAGIDPLALGRIDTFRFEERSLLKAADRLIADGNPEKARELVEGRMASFWTSVSRFPERRAAWRACGALAELAVEARRVAAAVGSTKASSTDWVRAYAAGDGWHRVDQLFRQARYLLSTMEDEIDLEQAAQAVYAEYDSLLEKLAQGFVRVLGSSSWQDPETLHQTQIFEKRVRPADAPVAYMLADALRFEMGAELAQLLKAAGASSLRLEPAIAATPTITEVGMVAVLPGAHRSFSLVETPKGVSGSIGGRALAGSAARMEYAKGEVTDLVEMTLDAVLEAKRAKLEAALKGAKTVIVRSQEIDGAGENLPNHLAQKVMGTVLEDLRRAVLMLVDAGVRRFVITADHGHLFAARRGDDMKVDPPAGGTCADLHRRCWVGRGGDTPSSCVRIPCPDLGHSVDLDLVVPRGLAVFKAGGDLVFHHGGLSLQELVIPVLALEMPERPAPHRRSRADELAFPTAPSQITNRIFSVTLARVQMGLPGSELRVRLMAVDPASDRVVGQAIAATAGWDPGAHVVTLIDKPVDVALQLDDDSVAEIRIVAVEAGTDRTLRDTPPIPVSLLR